MKYNLVIEKVEGGYIGYVPEIPGANTQGRTQEEVVMNIREAVRLVLEDRAEEALKSLKDSSKYTIQQIDL
jgi:predicted RNase H-like HicB family nuclease